ncbi:MAG: hypothetical protein RLZZ292_3432, partial [Bacteroidota bacterium]
MYTSYIGKKFLQLYREKEKKPDDYSARQFFDEVLFPSFFDNEQHLMHVGNSPFFQKPKEEDVKLHGGKGKAQYQNLIREVEAGIPSGAIFVGYAAKEITATSTGQLTSMKMDIDSEEIYASWIGEALGIGVSGGLVMLIDKSDILLTLFDGWKQYRKFIQQTPNLKDKQIETWNGQWLAHCFKDYFDPSDPLDNLNIETGEVLGKLAIPTKSWSEVVFCLAWKYPNERLTTYAYNLSQTNTTLGFIQLFLPEIQEMYELRDKIFISKDDVLLKDIEIAKLETFYNFRNACRMGTIGLKALEPAKLREFMPSGSVPYAQGKDYKFTDENSKLNYSLYKLWIIAMLNKTELLQLATDTATALLDYDNKGKGDNRGKTDKTQDIKKVKDAKHIREFIEGLTNIISNTNAEIFHQLVKQAYIDVAVDNFPLFITLIR